MMGRKRISDEQENNLDLNAELEHEVNNEQLEYKFNLDEPFD